MLNKRVIARLDIKGPNLVKGIHLEGLRVLGAPEFFADYYYKAGADELMYMDVVASLYERNSLHDIISKTAKRTFIPLTVGGGIRTLDDINQVLRAGADKVCINTAAIKNPDLIKTASRKFGSSTIVVAIEAMKQADGRYLAFTDNGREYTGVDVLEWAKKVDELGAGEIVITSVDKEGTGLGFDQELVSRVASSVSIPVIAHGGAGSVQHVAEILKETEASAVAIASIFHYEAAKFYKMENFGATEGNTEFLKSGKSFSKISSINLTDLKRELVSLGVSCRLT